MSIQMMKGYGFPSARSVEFSGFAGLQDRALGEFYGDHSPEQFRTLPALDGFTFGTDPVTGAPTIVPDAGAGGAPTSNPTPSTGIGTLVAWGAAIYFAARMLK